jgi:transposase
MEHIAIDLGAKESQMCVRSGEGKIVDERRMATRPDKLRRYLGGRPKSRVILETGAEAFCGRRARAGPRARRGRTGG